MRSADILRSLLPSTGLLL